MDDDLKNQGEPPTVANLGARASALFEEAESAPRAGPAGDVPELRGAGEWDGARGAARV